MNTNNTLDITSGEHLIPDLAPALARGPEWLRTARRQARDRYNATPLPRRGIHLWRYTDPTTFLVRPELIEDNPPVEDQDSVIRDVKRRVDDGTLAALAVDYAGRDIQIFGVDSLAASGTVIAPLSTAVDSHRALVADRLYTLVGDSLGKFEAFNGALWNDGVFIYVPDNRTIELPIHLLRETGASGSAFFPRLLVIVGRNAELTLIDEYAGGPTDKENTTEVNGAVEIFAGDDSRVRYVAVQRQAAGVRMYLTHRARVGRNSHMLTIPLAFGGSVTKQNFGVLLDGSGADSRMYGMLFGSGYQHFDNHTLHEHRADHTTSDIDFKTVLRDKGVSAYTGLIRIEHHARTCEAYQENRNLLLNRGPKAETIPELEILNEDVKCTHGATIGPIDPESIFYLTARGIERAEAVRMIVSGFVASTLKQIPEDLQERISAFVTERLEGI